ncbi:BrnA antitoxin family protein [Panacagrimonas sp.]|uniref:BrnA antitoxin family protein n=1 Tax=Panacagrimonas sp. TaxID=2480088 RepID=UPI003B523819
MKKEYDFSTMKSWTNPYTSKLKKPVTIRMGDDVVSYFKSMSDETGIPYQSLINLYLRDCVAQDRKPDLSWRSKQPGA